MNVLAIWEPTRQLTIAMNVGMKEISNQPSVVFNAHNVAIMIRKPAM
jgi:hypothetical protein